MNSNITEFNSETDKAFQTAWHSAKGGDDNWYGFLKSYEAVPLTNEEKEMLLNSEMKIANKMIKKRIIIPPGIVYSNLMPS